MGKCILNFTSLEPDVGAFGHLLASMLPIITQADKTHVFLESKRGFSLQKKRLQYCAVIYLLTFVDKIYLDLTDGPRYWFACSLQFNNFFARELKTHAKD